MQTQDLIFPQFSIYYSSFHFDFVEINSYFFQKKFMGHVTYRANLFLIASLDRRTKISSKVVCVQNTINTFVLPRISSD